MRIGELAHATGTTTTTLRFYEDAGLLPAPARTSSGYRDFGRETVSRLDFIHRAQSAGLSLREIRQVLQIRDDGDPPCEHVRDLLARRLADLDAQVAELLALRQTLTGLHATAATADPETCSPGQSCYYL